jgi:hypothetical protein
MKWFAGCHTVEEVKSLYRTLAKQHHPDRGGDTQTMQDINAAYHAALSRMDGQKHNDGEREYTYQYNQQREQAAMDKIAELLRIRGTFDVYLIGTWVWVTGDTKPIKDELKKAGCQWHSKRSCWYWRASEYKHKGKMSKYGLGAIAARYGYEQFSADNNDYGMAAA